MKTLCKPSIYYNLLDDFKAKTLFLELLYDAGLSITFQTVFTESTD